MHNPFFILGNPRSGTSLFRIMLDSHPNIVVPPECGFVEWLYKKYMNWDQSKLTNFIEDVVSSRKFETWGITKEQLIKDFNQSHISTYQEACFRIYRLYALKNHNKKEVSYWGDKNNYYISIIPKLITIFPEAKFIHLIRDGRDVATSYIEMTDVKSTSKYKPKLPQEIHQIAKEWANNNELIHKQLSKTNKYLLIKFEDLVSNSQKSLSSVTNFLDIPYSDQMLNYNSKNKTQQKEPEELLAWKKKTLEKPDLSRIGKYKTFFSEEDISTFENVAYQTLKKFNYL